MVCRNSDVSRSALNHRENRSKHAADCANLLAGGVLGRRYGVEVADKSVGASMRWISMNATQLASKVQIGSLASGILLDHSPRIFVLAKADKLGMAKTIDLRFILHLFMA